MRDTLCSCALCAAYELWFNQLLFEIDSVRELFCANVRFFSVNLLPCQSYLLVRVLILLVPHVNLLLFLILLFLSHVVLDLILHTTHANCVSETNSAVRFSRVRAQKTEEFRQRLDRKLSEYKQKLQAENKEKRAVSPSRPEVSLKTPDASPQKSEVSQQKSDVSVQKSDVSRQKLDDGQLLTITSRLQRCVLILRVCPLSSSLC